MECIAKHQAGTGIAVAGQCDHYLMRTPSVSDPLVAALLEIAKVRFALFRERFGRDPGLDEPLLFDPEQDVPTAAAQAESRVQVVSAATASEVDANAVLRLLGYKLAHDV
jgi:hypothetical protein